MYRLKALGERHNMDITIEGFHSWMWRGLSFLLPFLFIGYIFQLYNAYALYQLSYHPEATWHVRAMIFCKNVIVAHRFLLLGTGVKCNVFCFVYRQHNDYINGNTGQTAREGQFKVSIYG